MSVDSSRVIDESVFGKKEEIIPLLLLLQLGESGQLSTNAFSSCNFSTAPRSRNFSRGMASMRTEDKV